MRSAAGSPTARRPAMRPPARRRRGGPDARRAGVRTPVPLGAGVGQALSSSEHEVRAARVVARELLHRPPDVSPAALDVLRAQLLLRGPARRDPELDARGD